jgi:hypothetical protein
MYNKHKAAAHVIFFFLFSPFLYIFIFQELAPVLTTSCVCVCVCTSFFCFHVFGRDSCVKFFFNRPRCGWRREAAGAVWLAGWLALTPSPFLPSSHGDTLPRSGQPSSNPSICIHIDRYTRSVEHTRKTLGQGEQQRRKSAREPKRGAFSR